MTRILTSIQKFDYVWCRGRNNILGTNTEFCPRERMDACVNESKRERRKRQNSKPRSRNRLQNIATTKPCKTARKQAKTESRRGFKRRTGQTSRPLFPTRIAENEDQLSNMLPYFADSFIPVRPALNPWNFNTCCWTLSSGFYGCWSVSLFSRYPWSAGICWQKWRCWSRFNSYGHAMGVHRYIVLCLPNKMYCNRILGQ